ncbi:hypothetical protein WJX81_004030 [Elliptochloris bilobata]|uniref:Uncharacterized protein n=1 Tax=Elliptochloris bilobata TaxID=381761 RepID=A0AAW1QJZ2_9CHLO
MAADYVVSTGALGAHAADEERELQPEAPGRSAQPQPPQGWGKGDGGAEAPGPEWIPEWGCPALWEVPQVPAPSDSQPPLPANWGENGDAKAAPPEEPGWSYYGCPPIDVVPILPEPTTPAPPQFWGQGVNDRTPRGPEWAYYGCPELSEADVTPHPRTASPPSWGDPATQTPPQSEVVTLGGYPISPFVATEGGPLPQQALAEETSTPPAQTGAQQLRGLTTSTRAVSSQAPEDEWCAGEGASVTSPLLPRMGPGPADAEGAANGDFGLPRGLPRVAVRGPRGGDQGGEYTDYGGIWGADPVGDTPKPYPHATESPPPQHWGHTGDSVADDTAYDGTYEQDVEDHGEGEGAFVGGPEPYEDMEGHEDGVYDDAPPVDETDC